MIVLCMVLNKAATSPKFDGAALLTLVSSILVPLVLAMR